MSEKVQPHLQGYLTRHYGNLKLRLSRLLGSDDLAGDALQDTWLKLSSRDESDGPSIIDSPGSYLVRMAVNMAVDIQRRQAKSLSMDEVDSLMELSDPQPGPALRVENDRELGKLVSLMDRLSGRRREILVLVRWEGMPQKEVAKRLGVSVKVVEHELKRAHDYLDARMNDDR